LNLILEKNSAFQHNRFEYFLNTETDCKKNDSLKLNFVWSFISVGWTFSLKVRQSYFSDFVLTNQQGKEAHTTSDFMHDQIIANNYTKINFKNLLFPCLKCAALQWCLS